MVVISTVEQWFSFKSLPRDVSEEKHSQLTFSSLGSVQICDLTVDGRLISLHYADLKQDMTEEGISQALDVCFKSCADGISTFLLLIQGGHYTKRERRMIEILQAHFGAEAVKYLVVLSLEDGNVADTIDDSLLDLINMCDGRYCRIPSSAAGDKLQALLEMVDYMLSENGVTGYTENMLAEARKRNTEDSAMNMLRQKVQEAAEKEQAFEELVKLHEERRAKEMEELKAKHAEERKKEAAEKKQYETKRESLEEAVISHRATLHLQMSAADDDDTNKISLILLGLSGSGKSSALNLILERAGNQYSINESGQEPPQSTLSCERKEVFAAGRKLILVDTPELWDEDGVENLELVKDCLALSLPGPHVYLLVLQMGRFTQGECEMLGHLQKIFGRDFAEHAIVLFVRFDGNQHRPQKINDYVTGAHAALQGLIQKCGSRYYELNVTTSHNALSYPQVKDLLSGINKLVASHGGRSHGVKRFSAQELQERKKVIEEGKEGALEVNSLLRDA
ncbi:GTPase IMAP family member 7 [Nibea albiflora]|uniref:GTPase IMAP family member 7 n=1 Tax=Nibea albiflora TaxID=240163 RepID=A0ACB7FJ12_NIBAL|nr:GTPase IMAP family member 7 [Nibea albiflora]